MRMKPKKPRAKKCKVCGEKFQPERHMQPCCSVKCAIAKVNKDKELNHKKELAIFRKKERESKLANKKKKNEYNRKDRLDKLQQVVNQYVLNVRDKGMPCCTCGKSSNSVKYDAGHYRSRGACPELRFELTNIHKQCSINCNGWGSGMRSEYREFIKFKYGPDHLEWLDGKHSPLKETLPDDEAIESELKRYRQLIRAAGLKAR